MLKNNKINKREKIRKMDIKRKKRRKKNSKIINELNQ